MTKQYINLPTKDRKDESLDKIAFSKLEAPNAWYEIASTDEEVLIIDLCARGMSMRDISNVIKLNFGMEFSVQEISRITDKVYPLVKDWQNRPLAHMYPIIFLDGIRFNVRESGKAVTKVVYIAMGVNSTGVKEIIGIWIGQSESARFWMGVLNEIKSRGVKDVLITCVDGLPGFSNAITSVFPLAKVQLCIVHQVRQTLMYVAEKDRPEFGKDLKEVHHSLNAESARDALEAVATKWPQYRPFLKNWTEKWHDLSHFFEYPEEVRRLIFSTNVIESLNAQLRRATRGGMVFPSDDSLIKILWLAQVNISKRWSRPIKNWKQIVAALAVDYADRINL